MPDKLSTFKSGSIRLTKSASNAISINSNIWMNFKRFEFLTNSVFEKFHPHFNSV